MKRLFGKFAGQLAMMLVLGASGAVIILKPDAAAASPAGTVSATIKVSVCGNNTWESGESCDGPDLNGRTCFDLGFVSGTLACDFACDFDTSGCTAAIIDPNNVTPDQVRSLTAAGYLTVQSGQSLIETTKLTAATQITINVPQSGGSGSITIAQGTEITRTDGAAFNPTQLSAADTAAESLSGYDSGQTIDGALFWGLSGSNLAYNQPITINIYVGTGKNGKTLNLIWSESGVSGWTNSGIVSSATCLVSGGLCSFQTTRSAFLLATETNASSSTSSSTSTTVSSPGVTPTSADSPDNNDLINTIVRTDIPEAVVALDTNGDGRIGKDEVTGVLTHWVEDWKRVMAGSLAVDRAKCDVNFDGECNPKDLSIILYYVGR